MDLSGGRHVKKFRDISLERLTDKPIRLAASGRRDSIRGFSKSQGYHQHVHTREKMGVAYHARKDNWVEIEIAGMFPEDGVEQEDRNESLKAWKLVLLHDRALWHGRHHNAILKSARGCVISRWRHAYPLSDSYNLQSLSQSVRISLGLRIRLTKRLDKSTYYWL